MSNVVLLMSDEHNPFISTPYGHEFVDTPNMQQLADSGTVYQNAYCPSPLCFPCRSAFMSGKRVHTIQTYNNNILNINPDNKSYGAALAEQGVHSVQLGKTDVYDKSVNLGFSELILPRDRTMLHRSVGRKPLMTAKSGADRASRYGVMDDPFALDDERMSAVIEWITERAADIQQNWVLAINLIKPHFPHYVTQELWDRYAEHADLPDYGIDEPSAQHPYAQDLRDYFSTESFTEEQVRGQRRGYYGCVEYVDRQLGRVMDALKTAGLYDDTNVIYTSDHGEMLGKFGMWWKCTLYEDSVRIPMIAAGPDFSSGETVTTPVDLFDMQAAMFEMVGADRPADWVGESLLRLDNDDNQHVVFSEYHGHGTRASAFMVRQGKWKFIYYADDDAPNQLFDIDTDPNELTNVIVQFPDRAAALEGELRQICSPEVEQDRAEQFIQQQLIAAQDSDLDVDN